MKIKHISIYVPICLFIIGLAMVLSTDAVQTLDFRQMYAVTGGGCGCDGTYDKCATACTPTADCSTYGQGDCTGAKYAKIGSCSECKADGGGTCYDGDDTSICCEYWPCSWDSQGQQCTSGGRQQTSPKSGCSDSCA